MRLFLGIFLCLFLISCKHVDQGDEPVEVPTDFKVYQEHFTELFGVETKCRISFAELSPGRPGRTIYQAYQVQINYDIWKDISEEARIVLIIHELGHCELGLHHTTGEHIMSDFIGTQVLVYLNNLEAEIEFMLSDEHPRIQSLRD